MRLIWAGMLACAAYAATEAELKDANGARIISYVVEAPEGAESRAGETDPAKQLGLFLCFPEHDRPVGDELYPVREALQRQGLLDGYVLLAGGPQERKFGPKDHEPIQKLIAWALKTYPINPRRVYMYGKGEGGKISGEFSMLYPKLTAGSISYSWGWWRMTPELETPLNAAQTMPEVYMVLGLRDLSYHLTNVRDAYSRTFAKGYHIIFREFADLGARTYHQPSNDDAVAWATRLRHKTMPLSGGEKVMIETVEKSPVARGGRFPALSIVGGAPAGVVLRKLLASPDAAVRTAAARTAQDAIYDEDTMTAVGRAALDKSPTVRREALRALALHANWRSAATQQALIDLALVPGRAMDADDRLTAADGIVFALRLQINGRRQDPALFTALVKLLTDSDERLRTMANNALAPIRDADYRGDLARKENKEPEGGWDAWLHRTTADALDYFSDYSACPGAKDEAVLQYCQGGGYLTGRYPATGAAMEQNPAEALRLTVAAAQTGYVPAQAMAGMLYAIGKGTQQDLVQARDWWQKAADAGHKLAARNLSAVYRGGAGVPADPKLSQKYLEQYVKSSSGGE
jgi:hypothetical protein